jgi:hypothetical protein
LEWVSSRRATRLGLRKRTFARDGVSGAALIGTRERVLFSLIGWWYGRVREADPPAARKDDKGLAAEGCRWVF